MQLLGLPTEILCLLPNYIRNIEDFTNVASTCRLLHAAFGTAKPSTILRLASDSAPTFFSPHPYFLVMATARQVAEWAVGDKARTIRLCKAFQGGMDGLLNLCIETAGITLEEIRRLHFIRFSTINPLSDRIDKMAGDQWGNTENFWSGGVSQPATITCFADRSTFQFVIYGELFAGTMRSFLEPHNKLPRFDINTRLEYVKYCIPDKRGIKRTGSLQTGPYAGEYEDIPEDWVAMDHILSCKRWDRLWQPLMDQVNVSFDEDWRQQLWRTAIQTLGLEGAELAIKVPAVTDSTAHTRSEAWQMRFATIIDHIKAIDAGRYKLGARRIPRLAGQYIYDYPDLGAEVGACINGYWGAEN
jgi:hypothetical protein